MPQDNIAAVRRWFEEVWNRRRSETIDEMLTDQSLCYTDDGPIVGPKEFRERMYVPLLVAFPDVRVEVESVIAQDDQVVARWRASATHDGDGLGFAATGRGVVLQGMTWFRIVDGKFVEGWQHSNMPEIFRGLSSDASS